MEQERGISISTSVMRFEWAGCEMNLLDTPGHNDFSEDTYRTLAAADSAIMLIDAVKGVEPQTIKLFQVCRMRGIPIVTFINKLDREGARPARAAFRNRGRARHPDLARDVARRAGQGVPRRLRPLEPETSALRARHVHSRSPLRSDVLH